MKPENMLDGAQYYSVERLLNLNGTVSKKKNLKSKRRFSDEQIQSLEVMFESETKLEPGKKAKLAKELGLQPRQVAIWFQNKRARWKSKLIEKDYGLLLADYNNLASQFEDLKKEKQSLLIQLQRLKNETETKSERIYQCQIQETAPGNSCTDGESDSNKIDLKVKNNIPSKPLDGMVSDNHANSSIKQGGLMVGMEEDSTEFLKLMEPAAADSSLTSPEDWGSLDSDGITHQAGTDSGDQWWDFWC